VRVSEIARRWQVCSQQIFGWRREALANMAEHVSAPNGSTPAFVSIVREASPPKTMQRTASAAPSIEIKISGVVIHVVSCTDDGALLTAVLRAVRASSQSA
jgi:transposase